MKTEVEIVSRFEHPVAFHSELMEAELTLRMDLMAKWLNSSPRNVHRHQKDIDRFSKIKNWSVANLQQKVNVCWQLLQRHKNELFLYNIVTSFSWTLKTHRNWRQELIFILGRSFCLFGWIGLVLFNLNWRQQSTL